jgi:hypothetical protein
MRYPLFVVTLLEKEAEALPTTEVRRELAKLGLIMLARGPRPALMAQKERTFVPFKYYPC